MPNPKDYSDQAEFMKVCVPAVTAEGKDHEAAVGQCMGMWHDREMGMKDNALKTVAESKYELVVQNRIIVFGGRDATGYAYGPNQDGSLGEYFTKSTELESEYTKTGRLLIDFEHGKDPDEIGNNKNQILGYVDWKTAEVTDDGVIVKRVLNRRHKYMKWLEPLIRAGLVGNSSEAVSGKTEKSVDGAITRWPLKRDTLTVNPMEPRMLTENPVAFAALKALTVDFPEYKSLIPSDSAALSEPGETFSTYSYPNTLTWLTTSTGDPAAHAGKEKKTMDEKELSKVIAEVSAKAVTDALAARDAEAKAKAEAEAAQKTLIDEAYKKGVEDAVKSRRAPNYNKIQKDPKKENENNGMSAFKHWLATGDVNSELIRPDEEYLKAGASYFADNETKAAWNVTTGASGAFLVPDPLYNQIIAKRDLASWVRKAPVTHFSTTADHLLVPRENTKHTSFVLTAEAAAYNEDEGTVSQKDLILYKYTKMQKVNEEFLMYQSTNWESWLAGALGRAEATTENTIFTDGTGTSEPEGIVPGSTNSSLTLATVDVIVPSEMTALIGKLGAGYNTGAAECGFLMANVTKWYLRGVTVSGYLAYVGTPDGGEFHGYPGYISDDMDPYTTESAKPLIFGNYSFYGVVEKPGMMIQRNPYLYMANGQIGIFASIFRGGGVLQSEAFYYMNSHS